MITQLATRLPEPEAIGECSALPDVALDLDVGLALDTLDSAAERLAEHAAATARRESESAATASAAQRLVRAVATRAYAVGGIRGVYEDYYRTDDSWAWPRDMPGAIQHVRAIADACVARHRRCVEEHGTASALRQEASRMRAEARAMERALKRIEARWSR